MNLHCYRFAPIVFLWFASVRLINRSWLDYHSHYTSSLIMIEGFIFNVNIYIIQLWVTFNNLLLLLVHIAAAICSLIFLYAWVSVSVHGGGEMMPLTHTVWHGRLGILAIAHHHSREVRTTLLLIFMFQFQYRLIIDSRRTCSKLSFFSIFFWRIWDLSLFMGGGCQIPQVTQGANCPIRSFLPVAWFLSDWHFPFPDTGIWASPLSLSPLSSSHNAHWRLDAARCW